MFEDFETFDIDIEGVNVHGVTGGDGPALVLLHGYPQTHAMWHKVAPALSGKYRVVAVDLRGYGRSGKPETDEYHSPYSKRSMAADVAKAMSVLGHERFRVLAHDRGARVAHRLALDWSDRVQEMMLLDIAPTREMYRDADTEFARAYWHWYYLVQPAPFPETMIGADPEFFWRSKCTTGSAGDSVFTREALTEYLECFADPATIHASCEDYRAAISIDIEHDNADGTQKISCPIQVIWGRHGVIEKCFNPVALWQERAENVTGFSLPCGHYIAEELPDSLLDSVSAFFTDQNNNNERKTI